MSERDIAGLCSGTRLTRAGRRLSPGNDIKVDDPERRPRYTAARSRYMVLDTKRSRSAAMGTVYFEDLEVSTEYIGPQCVVDENEMLEYNRRNDPWPLHVDATAARQSPFGGVIASGGFTITLLYRVSRGVDNTPDAPWALLVGFDWHVKFRAPVRAGDTLRIRATVLNKRPSNKPGRGLANGEVGAYESARGSCSRG